MSLEAIKIWWIAPVFQFEYEKWQESLKSVAFPKTTSELRSISRTRWVINLTCSRFSWQSFVVLVRHKSDLQLISGHYAYLCMDNLFLSIDASVVLHMYTLSNIRSTRPLKFMLSLLKLLAVHLFLTLNLKLARGFRTISSIQCRYEISILKYSTLSPNFFYLDNLFLSLKRVPYQSWIKNIE